MTGKDRMKQYNPFENVSGRYGAPMGRNGECPFELADEPMLVAQHCGGDGFYDRGGAYWGHSDVWAVWVPGTDNAAYVESNELGLPANVVAAIAAEKARLKSGG